MQHFLVWAVLCLPYHVKSFKAQAEAVLSHLETPHSKSSLPRGLIVPEFLVVMEGIRIGLQTSGKYELSVSGWQLEAP